MISHLTENEVLDLIETAKNARICRNAKLLKESLSPVWKGFGTKPDFSSYGDVSKAELMRLIGFCLIYDGYRANQPDHLTEGKKFLNKSIFYFDKLDLPERSALAKVDLALAYWYEGYLDETEIILNEVEEEFNDDNHIYSRVSVTRMILLLSKKRCKEAYKLACKVKPHISNCNEVEALAKWSENTILISKIPTCGQQA